MQGFTIQTITAFVAIHNDGDEGVMGAKLGETFYPLVGADEERIAQMFPIAEEIKRETGIEYKIVQFTGRTEVTDEITERYKQR